ncbi:MAG: glutathione S-transferase family protein [Leptolyngbya sp. SIO4C5]|nr:glutathione S-transferase family protein [Leptolyngbya sp. SIO4C5]
MYKLYDFLPSGNGYKVRLLLRQLERPFERIEVNILNRETRSEAFLAKNPNGRVPTLELESGRFLAESNAILYYLSQETDYFPRDRWQAARVMQWLFFEQYSHEPYIATSRYWITCLGQPEKYQPQLAQKQPGGYAALQVMEQHLAQHDFFVGDRYTIADIALFAYTHVAHEGNFDLSGFPAIRGWIERVQTQPRHIPISAG